MATHWLRVVVLQQLVFMPVAPLVAGWRGSQRTQDFARVLRASAAFPGASTQPAGCRTKPRVRHRTLRNRVRAVAWRCDMNACLTLRWSLDVPGTVL